MTDSILGETTMLMPSRSLLFLLAVTAGLSVASLYYIQPLLGGLTSAFQVSTQQVGSLPTLTQIGYALGMLLLNPLGDRYNRKKILLFKGIALVSALIITASAQQISTMMVASLLIGLTATLAQDIVPMAADLAPKEHRGHTVGTIMTGLLCGILLSRVLSGLIGEVFGWRTVFIFAAATVAVAVGTLYFVVNDNKPASQLNYGQLIFSITRLFIKHPSIRHATYTQGLLSLGFSAFWTTLSLMLKDSPLHLGSGVAGAFGLLGAFGAVLAPRFGRLIDQKGPLLISRIGCSFTVISFLILTITHFLSVSFSNQLIIIALATVIFDLGIQMSFISHQNLCYQSAPAALSRVNSVIIGVFIGMSLGSFCASYAYAHYGWSAVIIFCAVVSTLAFIVRMLSHK